MSAVFSSPFAAGILIVLGIVFIVLGASLAFEASDRKALDSRLKTSGPRYVWEPHTGMWEETKPLSTQVQPPASLGQLAMAALREDPRFADVFVRQNSGGLLDGTLTLYGRTKTEQDKWDARDLLWHVLIPPLPVPKGIFNEIAVTREIERSRPPRTIGKDDVSP